MVHRLASPCFLAAAALLLGSFVFGGGTRQALIGDALLQLAAIPALVYALLAFTAPGEKLPHRAALTGICLLAAIVALPLLYLVPLPPFLWHWLPGRTPLVDTAALIGRGPQWAPLSLSPRSTSLALLSLLPPVAMFLLTLRLDYRERRMMTLVIVAFGVGSASLGLLQLAQGPTSSLRFFEFTNVTEAVGFFANRNHFAALIAVTLVLAVAWAGIALIRAASAPPATLADPAVLLPAIAGFTVLVVLLCGQLMARSRAGIGLTIAGLLGASLIPLATERIRGVTTGRLVGLACLLTLVITTQFALYRIMERFEGDPLQDARVAFSHGTLGAALDMLPFGSGTGTFVQVYAMREKTSDLFSAYANRAHNDFAELWLETGIVGAAVLIACLYWLGRRMWVVWRGRLDGCGTEDAMIARAASLCILLLVAHSLVDYPLRTAALMCLLAFVAALHVEPCVAASPGSEPVIPQKRHNSSRRRVPAPPRPDRLTPDLAASMQRLPAGARVASGHNGVDWQPEAEWRQAWAQAAPADMRLDTGRRDSSDPDQR